MEIAIPVFGGLGLFLYGMTLMGSGLQQAAGERLKKIIEVLTNNRIMGVLVGAVVTMIIQSSSATTVMVVGFVNAGIMNLSQAVGVIMGANIGTTVTAQLIAFNLTDYAPIAIVVGMLIYLTAKDKKGKDFSDILIGFGILFIGMEMMGKGLSPLSESQLFNNMLIKLNNRYLAAIVGMILTTVLQSSSAATGLLQALAGQNLISINIALPILFGENIGTTTTAIISSVGANKTAKRAAVIHFLFNVIGTLVFMFFLSTFTENIVMKLSPGNVSRQIANAHTLFNLVNVAIQLPFANFLVKAAEKLIPGEDEEEREAKFLDDRILETPSIALGFAVKETVRMAQIVEENFLKSQKAFLEDEFDEIKNIFKMEEVIDDLEKEITDYVVKLTKKDLTPAQRELINKLIYITNDLERVGDHVENLAELSQGKQRDGLYFSEDATKGIAEMFNKANTVFKNAMEAFDKGDTDLARKALKIEEEVNQLEEDNKNAHIRRLNEGCCSTEAGVIYLDALSNLERVSDHATNIAKLVLDKD